jgi:hypothetical protein
MILLDLKAFAFEMDDDEGFNGGSVVRSCQRSLIDFQSACDLDFNSWFPELIQKLPQIFRHWDG